MRAPVGSRKATRRARFCVIVNDKKEERKDGSEKKYNRAEDFWKHATPAAAAAARTSAPGGMSSALPTTRVRPRSTAQWSPTCATSSSTSALAVAPAHRRLSFQGVAAAELGRTPVLCRVAAVTRQIQMKSCKVFYTLQYVFQYSHNVVEIC